MWKSGAATSTTLGAHRRPGGDQEIDAPDVAAVRQRARPWAGRSTPRCRGWSRILRPLAGDTCVPALTKAAHSAASSMRTEGTGPARARRSPSTRHQADLRIPLDMLRSSRASA